MEEQHQQGFGIVEIIVAMMIFAVIAVSAAPVLLKGLHTTAKSLSMAQAAKISNDVISSARLSASNCNTFSGFVETEISPQQDSRNNIYDITLDSQILQEGELAACTDQSHPTQWFQVTVTRNGTNEVLSQVRTIVAVPRMK